MAKRETTAVNRDGSAVQRQRHPNERCYVPLDDDRPQRGPADSGVASAAPEEKSPQPSMQEVFGPGIAGGRRWHAVTIAENAIAGKAIAKSGFEAVLGKTVGNCMHSLDVNQPRI